MRYVFAQVETSNCLLTVRQLVLRALLYEISTLNSALSDERINLLTEDLKLLLLYLRSSSKLISSLKIIR